MHASSDCCEKPADTWIDRLLPRRPASLLPVIAGLAAGTWLVGLAIATDRGAFLASPEWRIQPLFLASHFIALRLFVTSYTKNYLRGARHLEVDPADARRWALAALRPTGIAAALALAAPFCAYDLASLSSAEFHEYLLVPEQGVTAVDRMMGCVWCVEWIVNAYIWTLLVAFSVLTVWTLRHHRFVMPIQFVLQFRHYRPFLMMSVQGSTILLFFGLFYVFYVWYAEGELSDFVSLGITVAMLLGCFVPPWLMLRNQLEGAVRHEQDALARHLLTLHDGQNDASRVPARAEPHHFDEAITLLRAEYLDRLQQELGRSEGRAVIMRLLIPASTILWKVFRPLLVGL